MWFNVRGFVLGCNRAMPNFRCPDIAHGLVAWAHLKPDNGWLNGRIGGTFLCRVALVSSAGNFSQVCADTLNPSRGGGA